MDFGSVMIVLMVGAAIGYFGSLLVRALAKESELPKNALCLIKESEEDRLKVVWAGQETATASGLTYEQREQVQRLSLELNAWLGNPLVSPPRPTDVSAEPLPFALPSPILFSPAATGQPPEPSTGPDAPLPPVAVESNDGEEKPLKFSMSPVKIAQSVRDNWDKPKAIPPTPKSIIAEVDVILQERMLGTPFEKRGIRLLEKPDHTMLIEVGLNKYDGLDAVPSEDIRDLIRACVHEWMSRTMRK